MGWLSRVAKKHPNWNISPPPDAMPFVSSGGLVWDAAGPAVGSVTTVLRIKNEPHSWMCITEIAASGNCNILDPTGVIETPVILNASAIWGALSWVPTVNGSNCIQTQGTSTGAIFGTINVPGEPAGEGIGTLTTYSVRNGNQSIFVGPGDEFTIKVIGGNNVAGATDQVAKQLVWTVMGYTMLLPN